MTSIELSDGQISEFWECGYVAVPAITSRDEVILMRRVFERLFAEKAGREEGAQFDMMTHDEDDEPARLPAIISPVNFAPELRHTRYRANARAIARQLLGSTATAAFEHAILKPAQRGAATPWHQDEATRVDSNFVYEQVSIWMPLQEATIENGCMHYIPGSHKGDVLDHRSPKSDRKVHRDRMRGRIRFVSGNPLSASGRRRRNSSWPHIALRGTEQHQQCPVRLYPRLRDPACAPCRWPGLLLEP